MHLGTLLFSQFVYWLLFFWISGLFKLFVPFWTHNNIFTFSVCLPAALKKIQVMQQLTWFRWVIFSFLNFWLCSSCLFLFGHTTTFLLIFGAYGCLFWISKREKKSGWALDLSERRLGG